MISVAKGFFTEFWCAIYTNGDIRLYGYGESEKEAREDLDEKIKEHHETRYGQQTSHSAR